MAEIHIERKKNVWPWVLGLIVIALLIWGAFALMGDDRRPGPYAEQPAATAPATTTAADPAAPAAETTTGDAARDAAPSRNDDPTPPRQ